ncbi:hypothetical protein ACFJGW_12845 [Burkholderiaceae bacterium UC74_6]
MVPISSDPETLRAALSLCVDALQRRKANEIPEPLLEQLIERDWLEWHGGTLRLTTTGQNIYRRELALSKAGANAGAQDRQSTAPTRRS